MNWGFPSGRGEWCRRCIRLWNNTVEGHPLTYFADNLDDWAFRVNWEWDLVAYHFLTRGGNERPTGAQIKTCTSNLQWVCSLFNLTTEPFVVQFVQDVVRDGAFSAEALLPPENL